MSRNLREFFTWGIVVPLILAIAAGCSPSSPTASPTVAQATATVAATKPPVSPEATVSAVTVTCSLLNLNTLTGDELLATIPNFSSRMVREFLEYRPYVSIQQFRREIGKYVDEAQVAEYEQYIYVPVDPNEADVETLKQLPGVDDTIANALINGRPYDLREAFLDALGQSVSAQEREQASCYLEAEA